MTAGERQTSGFSLGAWQRELREASRSRDVSASAAATALWLESYADHGTGLNARPSVETLAAIQQVSEATIRRHLKELNAQGFIERTHGHTRNRPATYAIRMRNPQPEDTDVTPHVQISPQHEQQVTDQTVHEGYPTAKPSKTPKTSKDLLADAINQPLYVPMSHDLDELVDYLLEAVNDENIWLPTLDLDSDEQRAVRIIQEVIYALADAGKTDPVSYLRAIYEKDGAFRFGLAVREKWRGASGLNPTSNGQILKESMKI